MKNLYALSKKEAISLFVSPSLYVVTAFLVLIYSFNFIFFNGGESDLTPVSTLMWFLSILMVPLITMRSFAGETASGTIELLLTAPVGAAEVVLSKFFGCYTFYIATVMPYVGYTLIFGWYGDIDQGTVISTGLALLFTGALFTSIGIFASCLTSNLIVSAATSCGFIFILMIFGLFTDNKGDPLEMVARIGFIPHIKSLAEGQIDTRSIIYFISTTACMLCLTWLVVRSRGAFSRIKGAINRKLELIAGVLGVLALAALLTGIAWMHIEGLTSLKRIIDAYKNQGATYFAGKSIALVLAATFAIAAFVVFRKSRHGDNGGFLANIAHGQAGSSLLSAAAILLITINVNIFAHQKFSELRSIPGANLLGVIEYRVWDISEDGKNTLSIDTRRTLDELQNRLDIHVFFSDNPRTVYGQGSNFEGLSGKDFSDKVKKLLEKYANYSPNVHITYVDPEKERDKVEEYARLMEYPVEYMPRLATMTYHNSPNAKPRPFSAVNLLKPPTSKELMIGDKQVKFNGEYAITYAIKRIIDPRVIRVYFSTGHGEIPAKPTNGSFGSVEEFNKALRQAGVDTRQIMLKGQPIPADCDVLAIIAPDPRLPIGEDVANSIRDYVENGGSVMLTMKSAIYDPKTKLPPEDDPELIKLVKYWGGRPRRDIVVDNKQCMSGIPSKIYVTGVRNHRITAAERSITCMLTLSRSIRMDNEAEKKNKWWVEPLLETGDSAYSTQRYAKRSKRRNGPFVVAFTARKENPLRRVLVVGNTEFACDKSIDTAHNKAFLLSSIQWLAGREYTIRVEKKGERDRTLKLDNQSALTVNWISLAAMPAFWLLLGALVWWIRKQ